MKKMFIKEKIVRHSRRIHVSKAIQGYFIRRGRLASYTNSFQSQGSFYFLHTENKLGDKALEHDHSSVFFLRGFLNISALP